MKTHLLKLRGRLPAKLFVVTSLVTGFALAGFAAEPFTQWSGGGATPKWSDNNNWNPAGAPSYGTLTFTNGGTQGTTITNDSITSMHSLYWGGGATGLSWTVGQGGTTVLSLFDFSGAQPKVENDSIGSVTINTPIVYASNNGGPPNPFGELNAVAGDLTFNSTLTVNGTSVNGIKLFGGGHNVNFNTTVSASGKWFGITTGGTGNTINIGGAFTSGDFYVMNGGTVNLNNGGTFGTTAVRLGGDFGTTGNQNQTKGGTFNLTATAGGQTYSSVINAVAGNTSAALMVNSQNTSATNTLGGHIALDTNLLVTQTAGGTLNITQLRSSSSDTGSGTDIKGSTLIFSAAANGVINYSGTIYNSAGNGTITNNGPGRVTLSGTNTFSGPLVNTAGIVRLANNSAAGSGSKTLLANNNRTNAFEVDGGVTIPSTIAFKLSNDGSGSGNSVPYALRSVTGSNTIAGPIIMTSGAGASIITVDAGSTLDLNGSITNDSARTLILQGSGTGIINGVVADLTGVTTMQVSNGVWVLANANTYSGVTTIGGGDLKAANTTGSATGSAGVSLSGAILSSGTGNNGGTVSGLVTTTGSTSHIKPGDTGGIGTLNLGGGLTLGGTTPALDFDLSGSSQTAGGGINDEVVVTGAVTVNATTTINATLGGIPVGSVSYTLMTYGSKAGSAGFSIGTITPTPTSSSLTVNAGSLVLNLTYPQVNAYKITAATTSPNVGAGDQLTITAVDNSGNAVTTFNGNIALTFSGLATTGGTPTVTDKTGAAQSQGTATTLTFASGVASTASGAAILTTYTTGSQTLHVTDGTHSDASTGGQPLPLTPVAGAAATTSVETAADGSGSVAGAQNVTAGGSITVYAIARDSFGNFTGNPSATWSLQNITGGVVSGDLAASGASATFTGNLVGSAKIQAVANTFTGQSGVQTVVAGAAVATSVETAANGGGSVVSAQNVAIGTSITAYSISRDANGNFIGNVAATWSLQNITGNVVSGDLAVAGDTKSAVFSGHLTGTAKIQAVASTFTGQSGTLTVTPPGTASDNACNYSGTGDWTGVNGGTGFLLWTNRSVGSGSGGFFRGSSANNGGSGADNIDTSCSGSFSWGMYSGGTTLLTDSAHVWRPFPGKLQIGQTYSVDMDNGFVDGTAPGTVGFALQNSAQQDLFKVSFTGGQSTYQINNANPSPTIPFTGDGLRITFRLTSATTYSATVASPNTGAAITYTGSLLSQSDQTISQVVLFTDGAGNGPNFDAFFNSMSIGNPALTLAPGSGALTAGTYGSAYSQSIVPSGGTAPYTYAITSGSLGGGLSLDTSAGVISGTPTATNTYNFTVMVTDAYGYTGTVTYSLAVNPLPVILTGTRVYDGTTDAAAAILSVANAVGGDTVDVASGAGALAGQNAGSETITSFGTLALGNNTAGNYTLAGASGSVVITQATTAIGVVSSENPSGYKDSLSFTASLPADASGNVVFRINSVLFDTEALSGGTAISAATTTVPRGANTITAEYAGDINYVGSTNSLTQTVTNHPPTAMPFTVTRTAGLSLLVSLSDVATNWSDVDGDTVTLAGVNLVTTNNINLMTNSVWVLYTNSPNVNDQFSYSISDGHGGTNIGYVNIVINNSVTGTNSIAKITAGNPTALTAYGIPGYSYVTERSTDLSTWTAISTNTAASNGVISVSDAFSDLGGTEPPSAYYRLRWQP